MSDLRILLAAFGAALVLLYSEAIVRAFRNLVWLDRVLRVCRREPVVVILRYGDGVRSALHKVHRIDVSQPDGWRTFVAGDGGAQMVGVVRPTPSPPEEVFVTLEGKS